MADQVLTKQKLINADEDLGDLEEVLNGPPGKLIKTRLGREVYTLASVPQINTMTREEVTAAVAPKANKADVDTALSNLSTTANKFYPTLAEANYYITTMAVNDVVTVGEEANKGLWYKATAGATSLTKSAYDPLTQAKGYIDSNPFLKPVLNPVEKNLNNIGHNSIYQFSNIHATLENNFPVVDVATYIETVKLEGSSFLYQTATLIPFQSKLRTFKRYKVSSNWSQWQEESIDIAKDFINTNPFLNPVLNPTENNLNNIAHNSIYQYSAANATLANNFPVAGVTTYLETFKLEGSLFVYQKATAVAVDSEPKTYLRSGASGAWSNWVEIATKNTFIPPLVSTAVDLNTLAGKNGYSLYSRPVTTLGNHYPLAGESFFVETSTATGSLFTLQRAVSVSTDKPREFLRRYNGAWSDWVEQVAKGEVGGFDDAAWYKYVNADSPSIYQDKLPNFRRNTLLKNKDMCVVMTGTSLTASTSQHCTLRTDAHLRPPNMHANAFGSYIWDVLKWEGQQYRRYDASYFTEIGTFTTKSKDDLWDDQTRDGLTRMSDSTNASVGFVIPVDAWQFNFIYRTESTGCTATVSIAEGNSRVQVYDETTSTWVEANGYSFSMLEATPVTRTVAIPDLITEVPTNYTLSSKANTTYQKRLKMRCRSGDGSFDSRASAKNVTIANASGSGRFLYWGVEWSPRQYMMTFINSSRGSHATDARKTTGLPRYQDNEVWAFKPDLILSELAVHNDGASGAGVFPVGTWERLAKQYVTDINYELSLYSRAAHFGQTPEYAFFVGSITWNFGGINEDGTLKFSTQTASALGGARAMSALDKYHEAIQYLRSQNIVCLDTAEHWVEACKAVFGDIKAATVASGKTGATFTDEGSHWNDNGAKVMAKAVIPLIK